MERYERFLKQHGLDLNGIELKELHHDPPREEDEEEEKNEETKPDSLPEI